MASADRAINMAMRGLGIGDVERDFKRAGDAGEKSFSRVEKAANGAAREVSDYHARLKRVALAARADTADMPDMWKGDVLDAVGLAHARLLVVSHDDLMALDGHYAHLFTLQARGYR